MIFIRHYFPSVNTEEMSDEDFAILSEDAQWLHSQMLLSAQSNMAAAMGMGGAPQKR